MTRNSKEKSIIGPLAGVMAVITIYRDLCSCYLQTNSSAAAKGAESRAGDDRNQAGTGRRTAGAGSRSKTDDCGCRGIQLFSSTGYEGCTD